MSEGASNNNHHSSSSDDDSLSSYESEVSDSVDDYSSSDSSSSSSVGSSYESSSSDNESRSSEHLSSSRSMDGNNINGSNTQDDPQSLQSNNMSTNHTTATYREDQHSKNSGSSKLTHRRNGKSIPQCRPDDDNEYEEPSRSKYRRRDKSSRHKERKKGSNDNILIKYICCQTTKRSTQILIFAFALWIVAQGYYFYNYTTNTNHKRRRNGQHNRHTMERMIHHRHADENIMEQLRKQRMIEAQIALGSAAGDPVDTETGYRRSRDRGGKPIKTRTNHGGRDRRSMGYNHNNRNNNNNKSRDPEGNTRTERLRDGCSKLDWHDYHYPNCNEIHEIDMRRVIEYGKFGGRRKKKKNMDSSDDDDDSEDESSTDNTQTTPRQKYPWGFVGNGLWRDVFTCDPREESLTTPVAPAVLKMMKSEHKYDARNFNRHRRDALVMERLSSSHHLVPIYGYCSQTVLTQAISHTLDDVIYAREHESVKKWSPNDGYKTKPPLESWMGTDEDGELLATRETEVGRIKLALGVFRGLVDLHEGDRTTNSSNWLPVVHADLQSKQYLIDAHTGQIYLNDFNRCRFMTKNDRPDTDIDNTTSTSSDSTLKSCPLYIGSAPGSSRSPEEYSMEALSEKLDIYSAGNVLYGIITGNRPWNNERGKHVKSDIQKGKRPHVDDAIRNAVGTVDAELTRLLDRAYEHDPTKRASAREIVDELEKLLDRELKKRE